MFPPQLLCSLDDGEKMNWAVLLTIVPLSVHYAVLLSETFMALQDASLGTGVTSLFAELQTGTSKKLWKCPIERSWLTFFQNYSVSHTPITWFLNTAAQIESSHRNRPLRQTTFQQKVFISIEHDERHWMKRKLLETITDSVEKNRQWL